MCVIARGALVLLLTASMSFAQGVPPRAGDALPGQLIILPTSADKSPGLAELAALRSIEVIDRDEVSGALLVRVPRGDEALWMTRLSAEPEVGAVERNALGQGGFVPSDTHFDAQWHHHNTANPGADISAVGAWDITRGSPSVVVAVLDTGIDTDHTDFLGRVAPGGFDFVNEDANPEADHPHGTWVSGCVGANANNHFACAGVDHFCKILPVKVLNNQNLGTTFDLAQGLNYCATRPEVDVVCMSLINYPGNSTLINAINNARNNGKILVACAGNGGVGNADASWPGASPNTISIGATTIADTRAGFSGTGSALDFVAPGESVVTTRHASNADSFDVVSGCSFATPIAAGIVSLMLAHAESQSASGLTQSQVYELLQAGADDMVGPAGEDTPGRDNFFGHGRLNAHASLLALTDCNNNGAFDYLDLELGTSPDCNANGVPDECDIASGLDSDCNQNGVPDACDIASGAALDCNANGVPDSCDIASGFADDCNQNGVPDLCDITPVTFDDASPDLFPLGGGFTAEHVIASPPEAGSDVVLEFTATGDLSSPTENVQVRLNGMSLGFIFVSGALDCVESTAQIVLTPGSFNSFVGGGDLVISMTPSSGVNGTQCSPSKISVRTTYDLPTFSDDDNGDSIPDECPPTTGCAGDVTTTGAANGQPGFGVPDGVTNLSDLLFFVTIWDADLGIPSPNPGSFADVTTTGTSDGDPGFGSPDGNVDFADLLYFVNEWNDGLGLCPA